MTGGVDFAAWRARHTPGPVTFTLDGVEYEVPDQPARVWVLGVLSDEPADLLLDVLPEAVAAELWDDAMDPDSGVTPELLAEMGRGVLGRVAGRPWWQATQLVGVLVGDWELWSGRAADRGLGDLLEWPLERLCNWLYTRMVDGRSAEERARVDASLAAPATITEASSAGGEDDAPWADEASGWLQLAGMQPDGGQVVRA